MSEHKTFEDWWQANQLEYVTTKDLARDAWFAAQKVMVDFQNSIADNVAISNMAAVIR